MLTEVKGYLRRNGFSEDALQEGLIAAWEAEVKNPGQQVGYYARAGKYGAKSYLMGKKTTGRNAQGKKSLATSVMVLDDTPERIDSSRALIPEDGWARNIDVRDALDSLSDPHYEYVRLRFFEGHTHAESAKRAGVAYTAWSYTIRPKLERALSEDSI